MEKAKAIELLKIAVPQDESLDEDGLFIEAISMAIKALEKAETNCPEIPDSWVPCSKKMPEEHEWIGTKQFGTTISDEVYVTFCDFVEAIIERLKRGEEDEM